MARKVDEPVFFPITERFTQEGVSFDALLMDTAKVLFAQWLHTEDQGRVGR